MQKGPTLKTIKSMFPRKKTSPGESLAKSRAYNPIRNSRWDAWRARSFAKSLAENLTKSLSETFSETLGETFGETLGEAFRARQASPQILGSDYMYSSPQDSPRLVFYAGTDIINKFEIQSVYFPDIPCRKLLLHTDCLLHSF